MDLVFESSPSRVRLPDDPIISGRPQPKTKIWEGMKAIDWFATVTVLGVTLMTLMGLDFGGETFPWNSPKVICLVVFGVLMLGFFIFNEAKLARYPLIPLPLFRQRSNVAALGVCFVHGFVSTALHHQGRV